MKKKLLSLICILSFTLSLCVPSNKAHAYMDPADSVCPNHPKVCAIFDVLNAKITPLPVTDLQATVGLIVANVEQTLEAVQSGLQYTEKVHKMLKLSLSGFDLSRLLKKIDVPSVEDYTKGKNTLVDAYKDKVPDVPLVPVDFMDKDETARTIHDVAVVSNPKSSPERLAYEERKAAFIQQSVLDLAARTLYYKYELEQLVQTDEDLQGITGSGDTRGTIDISMQAKDVERRIQALQEKVMAARLEVQAIKNLKAAEPVKEKIQIVTERYGENEWNF